MPWACYLWPAGEKGGGKKRRTLRRAQEQERNKVSKQLFPTCGQVRLVKKKKEKKEKVLRSAT